VGRDTELQQLHIWLEKALNGERQIVFVTGEAGIGKTALGEAFLFGMRSRKEFGVQNPLSPTPNSELPSTPIPWFAWGQCIEQFGTGEAYLPVLSALGQLGRESGHERLTEVLRHYAPTWLMQLPALVPPDQMELLLRQTAGATRERMLREIAEALEVLTAAVMFPSC
jgi:predicted ATPase